MVKILASALLLFGFLSELSAQNFHVEKIREANPEFPAEVYEFPMLKGDSLICHKINSTLIREQLDLDYGTQTKSIFENVWRTGNEPMAKLNYLTYKPELLNDRIYSVTLSGEWCGAYCEGSDMTYTFDLKSGNLIKLDTLFTPSGRIALRDKFVSYKRGLIDNEIKEVKAILNSDTLKAENRESYNEILDLYENCNTDYDSLQYLRFIPSADSLKLIGERCSAHFNMALDELWYFELAFSLDQLRDWLSDYGKKELLN